MGENRRILFKLESTGAEQSVDVPPGESLLEAAKRAGVALDAPCGGSGTCGKCRIKVLAGDVKGGQSRHIAPQEFADGWRLACESYAESDIAALVPDTASAWQRSIRVDGSDSIRGNAAFRELLGELEAMGLKPDSGLSLTRLALDPPSIDNPMADRERLLQKLERQTGMRADVALYALCKLPSLLRQADFSVCCVLRRETAGLTVLDIFPGGAAPVIAGLAVDIGTTTVSALLVNLLSGDILASASAGNGQIRYGADVISRIIESGKSGGQERLRRAVTDECLVPLIVRLCEAAAIPGEQIYRAAIAANTTMTHLFLGVDPAYVRLEPYTPAFFESGPLSAAALGLPLHPDAEAAIAPAIGSYVGGDITSGVFASMMFKKPEISLLIDLGTNGELVLGNSEFLMSCACSAGPAFEGGDIGCGMRATDGAIEACAVDRKTMAPQCTVIGGQKPLGLCGSGLIDLIGELFRCGIINARGKFVKEGNRIRRDEWGGAAYIAAFADESADGREICLGESDIDNFIRAKGSIFSAIQTLLASLDFDYSVIENVYVAGGIGSGINMRNAIRIGMLPNLPAEKFKYIGNSSLHGAYSMLVSSEAAAMIEQTGRGMTYIELSTHPGYMDELVAACFLPHTNGALFEYIE
ncbi:MAG: corrinoid activation/regeneration protein AcsV [Treponema sp.]|nr:corrinoid activation/regeneration protein AcsV [Treponema sp.]